MEFVRLILALSGAQTYGDIRRLFLQGRHVKLFADRNGVQSASPCRQDVVVLASHDFSSRTKRRKMSQQRADAVASMYYRRAFHHNQ